MNWHKNFSFFPQYYWWKVDPEDLHPYIRAVYRDSEDRLVTHLLHTANDVKPVSAVGGYWAGPIPEPGKE